jgi:hypothetical protein
MGIPTHCSCPTSSPVTAAGGERVCYHCGLLVVQKGAARASNRATIPPELVEHARWEIKMLQRLIAEKRQKFGIQE